MPRNCSELKSGGTIPMLSPHPEKWGDASPPRPPPIDARDNMYIIYEKHMGPIIQGVRYILLVKLFVTELLACTTSRQRRQPCMSTKSTSQRNATVRTKHNEDCKLLKLLAFSQCSLSSLLVFFLEGINASMPIQG